MNNRPAPNFSTYINRYHYDLLSDIIFTIRSSTVENYIKTFVDGKDSWEVTELKQMQAMTLENIEFEMPKELKDGESPTFQIRNKMNGDAITFSDRNPTKGELRSSVLRNALMQLKAVNPKMSLYDALSALIRDLSKSDILNAWVNGVHDSADDDDSSKPWEMYQPKLKAAWIALVSPLLALIDEAIKIDHVNAFKDELNQYQQQIRGILLLENPDQIEKAMAQIINDHSAQFRLIKAITTLDHSDPRKAMAVNLLKKVAVFKERYPQDTALLNKVLLQTAGIIEDPNPQRLANYATLSHEISEKEWGKMIGTAMLGIIFTTMFALCCVSTFGGAALPVIGWGLSYLIPVLITSFAASTASVTLFAKSAQKNQALSEVSQEMDKVTPPLSNQQN